LPSQTDYANTGLIVTMNNAYTLTSFALVPQISVVSTASLYTVNVVHVVPLLANDYILLNIDSSMNISSIVTCTPVTGLTTISCLRISNSQLKIIYVSAPSSQTLQYQISNITNYDIAGISLSLSALVYASTTFTK
jgi:hypothetical protein